MKEMIKNYFKYGYDISLRAENSGFSEEEIKESRDNFLRDLDRYWNVPPTNIGRAALLHKKVHEVCDEVLQKGKIDIVEKRIVFDDPKFIIIWSWGLIKWNT